MEKGNPVRALPFRQPVLTCGLALGSIGVTAGHTPWLPGRAYLTANRRHWLAARSSATKRLKFNAELALAGTEFAPAIPGRLDRRQDRGSDTVALKFPDRVDSGATGGGDRLAQQDRMLA
jgi:hypothetical protein